MFNKPFLRPPFDEKKIKTSNVTLYFEILWKKKEHFTKLYLIYSFNVLANIYRLLTRCLFHFYYWGGIYPGTIPGIPYIPGTGAIPGGPIGYIYGIAMPLGICTKPGLGTPYMGACPARVIGYAFPGPGYNVSIFFA